jgi:hypothetical protein
MHSTPTASPEALATFERWFRAQEQILVRTRDPIGGSDEFEFFSSFDTLKTRMQEADPYTCFTVWENAQLPLRGVVDDDFIARCLSSIPDEAEYLIVETVRRVAGKASWFYNTSDRSHTLLRSDLEDSRGTPVAVGLYPTCLEERADVIHVFRPDADGKTKRAPYKPPTEEKRQEAVRLADLEFYQQLTPEDASRPCAREGCRRGAIQCGVLCKRHHFEMIRRRDCPFDH